jgi:hypothetical protein
MAFKTDPKIGQQNARFGADAKGLRIRRARVRTRELSVLTAKRRNKLPSSAFALPGRRYPIHDIGHARNALSRVAQHGTPEEQAKVRAAVAKRYGKKIAAVRKRRQGKGAGQKDVQLALPHDHESSVHPDLPNKPDKTNWVERQGGLPNFIMRVAKHIMYDGGLTESHAIAAAVQQCRDGHFGAKGLAAYAEFRAKAAAARAS